MIGKERPEKILVENAQCFMEFRKLYMIFGYEIKSGYRVGPTEALVFEPPSPPQKNAK